MDISKFGINGIDFALLGIGLLIYWRKSIWKKKYLNVWRRSK